MSTARRPDDSLHQLLDEAESELHRRLHEACEAEAQGVTNESAAEIRRLEDTLLAAAMAAERTLVARKHLQNAAVDAVRDAQAAAQANAQANAQAAAQANAQANAQAKADAEADPDSSTVREFEDETGRKWRAWPVVPDAQRQQQGSLRGLGDYQAGWICFEARDSSGRRRLPRPGRRWSDVSAEELPQLLAAAINVPARKRH